MKRNKTRGHARLFGKNMYHFSAIDSTNSMAKRLAEMGESEGTVVTAEVQTEGRGRGDRKWASPPGGLYLSIILRPELPVESAGGLTLVAGVAVVKVIRSMYALRAMLKWPNDVLIGHGKVCGILTESGTLDSKLRFLVVGIGINLNNDMSCEFPDSTSLKKELRAEVSKKELVREMLETLEREYDRFLSRGLKPFLSEWKTLSGDIGKRVTVHCGKERLNGKVLDIDESGRLVVIDDIGKRTKQVSADDICVWEC